MGLREKVALLLVAVIFQTVCTDCQLQSSAQNPFERYVGKKLKRTLDNSRSSYGACAKPSIYKTFNFPEVDFPSEKIHKDPSTFYHGSPRTQISTNKVRDATLLETFKKEARNKRKSKKQVNNLPIHSPSQDQPSCYVVDKGAFPEVEYPLNVIDTWTPKYWNSPAYNMDKHFNQHNDFVPQNQANIKQTNINTFVNPKNIKRYKGILAANKPKMNNEKTKFVNLSKPKDNNRKILIDCSKTCPRTMITLNPKNKNILKEILPQNTTENVSSNNCTSNGKASEGSANESDIPQLEKLSSSDLKHLAELVLKEIGPLPNTYRLPTNFVIPEYITLDNQTTSDILPENMIDTSLLSKYTTTSDYKYNNSDVKNLTELYYLVKKLLEQISSRQKNVPDYISSEITNTDSPTEHILPNPVVPDNTNKQSPSSSTEPNNIPSIPQDQTMTQPQPICPIPNKDQCSIYDQPESTLSNNTFTLMDILNGTTSSKYTENSQHIQQNESKTSQNDLDSPNTVKEIKTDNLLNYSSSDISKDKLSNNDKLQDILDFQTKPDNNALEHTSPSDGKVDNIPIENVSKDISSNYMAEVPENDTFKDAPVNGNLKNNTVNPKAEDSQTVSDITRQTDIPSTIANSKVQDMPTNNKTTDIISNEDLTKVSEYNPSKNSSEAADNPQYGMIDPPHNVAENGTFRAVPGNGNTENKTVDSKIEDNRNIPKNNTSQLSIPANDKVESKPIDNSTDILSPDVLKKVSEVDSLPAGNGNGGIDNLQKGILDTPAKIPENSALEDIPEDINLENKKLDSKENIQNIANNNILNGIPSTPANSKVEDIPTDSRLKDIPRNDVLNNVLKYESLSAKNSSETEDKLQSGLVDTPDKLPENDTLKAAESNGIIQNIKEDSNIEDIQTISNNTSAPSIPGDDKVESILTDNKSKDNTSYSDLPAQNSSKAEDKLQYGIADTSGNETENSTLEDVSKNRDSENNTVNSKIEDNQSKPDNNTQTGSPPTSAIGKVEDIPADSTLKDISSNNDLNSMPEYESLPAKNSGKAEDKLQNDLVDTPGKVLENDTTGVVPDNGIIENRSVDLKKENIQTISNNNTSAPSITANDKVDAIPTDKKSKDISKNEYLKNVPEFQSLPPKNNSDEINNLQKGVVDTPANIPENSTFGDIPRNGDLENKTVNSEIENIGTIPDNNTLTGITSTPVNDKVVDIPTDNTLKDTPSKEVLNNVPEYGNVLLPAKNTSEAENTVQSGLVDMPGKLSKNDTLGAVAGNGIIENKTADSKIENIQTISNNNTSSQSIPADDKVEAIPTGNTLKDIPNNADLKNVPEYEPLQTTNSSVAEDKLEHRTADTSDKPAENDTLEDMSKNGDLENKTVNSKTENNLSKLDNNTLSDSLPSSAIGKAEDIPTESTLKNILSNDDLNNIPEYESLPAKNSSEAEDKLQQGMFDSPSKIPENDKLGAVPGNENMGNNTVLSKIQEIQTIPINNTDTSSIPANDKVKDMSIDNKSKEFSSTDKLKNKPEYDSLPANNNSESNDKLQQDIDKSGKVPENDIFGDVPVNGDLDNKTHSRIDGIQSISDNNTLADISSTPANGKLDDMPADNTLKDIPNKDELKNVPEYDSLLAKNNSETVDKIQPGIVDEPDKVPVDSDLESVPKNGDLENNPKLDGTQTVTDNNKLASTPSLPVNDNEDIPTDNKLKDIAKKDNLKNLSESEKLPAKNSGKLDDKLQPGIVDTSGKVPENSALGTIPENADLENKTVDSKLDSIQTIPDTPNTPSIPGNGKVENILIDNEVKDISSKDNLKDVPVQKNEKVEDNLP